MATSFETIVKSILYVLAGILFGGAILDSFSNSLSLISFPITLWGSISIAVLWIALYFWIRANKPYWGKGAYRISKPNRQINLGVLGIILLLWIPPFLRILGTKQEPSTEVNIELLDQNSKLLQLTFQSKIECEKLLTENCEKKIESKTGVSILKIIEISKTIRDTSSNLLDLGNAAVFLNDYKEAIKSYVNAANKGDVHAQYNLGFMYFYGLGVKQDYHKAAAWAKKAAEQGYAIAQYQLGMLYLDGFGVEKDIKEAETWFLKAAKGGDLLSQAYIGELYIHGKIFEKDRAKGLEWTLKAAKAGYYGAQYNLGVFYENGGFVEQDYVKAAEWYTKAATQGFPAAQGALGELYLNGLGVNKDIPKSIELFIKAGEQGDDQAPLQMVKLHSAGIGVSKDSIKAFEYAELSAQNGFADAQFIVGYCYRYGRVPGYDDFVGASQDISKAVKWLTLAAQQNHPEAQFELGKLYFTGFGVPEDRNKAIELWVKAAKVGNYHARKKLTNMGMKW